MKKVKVNFVGFPGWHIECSAMSSKYLGKQFDIHTGGIDHIPIHHTNEIAQSESAFRKKPWVKYWLHGAWLLFKEEKVSKSKGGLFTVSELEKKGFDALVFRYLCLTTHYRKPLNFTIKNLETAKNSYVKLKNIISGLKDDTLKGIPRGHDASKKINEKYLQEFESAMNDDLNTPNALQVLWGLVRDEKAVGKISTIKKIDGVFGLDLLKKEKIKIPAEIQKLVKERNNTRKKKDWKKADELREEIKSRGYILEDRKGGSEVKRG